MKLEWNKRDGLRGCWPQGESIGCSGGDGVKQHICLVAVLLSVFWAAAAVAAASGKHSNQASSDRQQLPQISYTAPYPFTADELWEKLLKAADKPEGYVTKAQAENIFGTTMKLNEEFLKQYHEKIYSLEREKNWYFNMSVGENRPARSFFYFNWGDMPGQRSAESPPPPPPGMCINIYMIRPNLQRSGWVLRREARGTNQLPYSDTYRKGRIGVLIIEFLPSDNCLRSIRISASPSEAQELPVE
jgi:hypothetical protein